MGNAELMREWFVKAEHDLLNAEIILRQGKQSLEARFRLLPYSA
jgi:hypothetical protein